MRRKNIKKKCFLFDRPCRVTVTKSMKYTVRKSDGFKCVVFHLSRLSFDDLIRSRSRSRSSLSGVALDSLLKDYIAACATSKRDKSKVGSFAKVMLESLRYGDN